NAHMSYDLRRLRLHGLIQRLPRSNRYVLTAEDIRVAVFYTKLHNRLLRPLLHADRPPAPLHIRRALATLQRSLDDYITTARLAAAAKTRHNVNSPCPQEGLAGRDPQDEQGDVVLRLGRREAHHRMLDRVGDLARRSAPGGLEELAQPLLAEELAVAAAVADPVRPQHDPVAGAQHDPLLVDGDVREDAEQRPRPPRLLHGPVGAEHERQRVPARGDAQLESVLERLCIGIGDGAELAAPGPLD